MVFSRGHWEYYAAVNKNKVDLIVRISIKVVIKEEKRGAEQMNSLIPGIQIKNHTHRYPTR